MTYTLTLLGTDTVYTPGQLDDAYDKAETLSYISSLINGTPGTTDGVTRFRNNKVAVVDGPTTYGEEVGDRIARGVQSILEAISRGEKNISIIAHSRGAVEAILVAHELERIQNLFKKPGFDRAELTNSVCAYTKPAMNGTHRDAFASLNLDNIALHIGGVKLAMLNIDPVPGGNYVGITHLTSLAWRDPRFYVIPKIVKEYEQYTYENERTRCFKPIVPKCTSPDTIFKLHSLPGHHGTGSGNLLDQQRGKVFVNPSTKSTEHVQQLALVKIIDFLTRNGVSITRPPVESDPFAALMAQLYDAPLTPEKLKALYYDLYTKIVENREAYQFYNQTSYKTLGQEKAILKRIWRVLDQRIVHYQAHNDTYLETIVPPVPGGRFLNYEHARIHLDREMGLTEGMSLSGTIHQAVTKLHEICRHKSQLKDLQDLKAKKAPVIPDPSQSMIMDAITPTLETKEGFALLLEGVGMLIEQVRQPYLQGELTDIEERGKIYEEISSAFALFKDYVGKHPTNELATTILDTMNKNLVATLDTKRKDLEEQYRSLSAKLKGNDFFVTLQGKMEEISTNLGQKGSGRDKDEYELHTKLSMFLNEAEKLALTNPKSSHIRAFIEQELTLFREMKVTTELAKNTLEWSCLLMDEAIDDSLNYELENMMSEVIDSHNELDNFRAGLPHFKALNDSLDYDKWELELEEKRDHMIRLAAQYIVKEELNLEKGIKPLFIGYDALYKQIAGFAVGLGAENPLAPDLALAKKQKRELSERVDTFVKQVETLTSKQQLLTEQLATENEEHQRVVERLTQEKLVITQELDTSNKSYERAEKQFAQEKQVLTQRLDRGTKQYEQAVLQFAQEREDFTRQLTQGKKVHETALSRFTQEKLSLEEQLIASKDKYEQAGRQFAQEKRDLSLEVVDSTEKYKRAELAFTQEKEALTQQLDKSIKKYEKAVQAFTEEKRVLTEQLSASTKKHELVVKQFAQEKQVLTEQVDVLTKQYDSAVLQFGREKDVLTEKLASFKLEQQLLVEGLNREKQALIDQLSAGTEEHQLAVEGLTREKQALIDQLSSGTEEHQLAVEGLTREKQALIDQLSSGTEEHQHAVEGLIREKQALIDQLSSGTEEHRRAVEGLTREKQALIDQLSSGTEEHQRAVEELIKEKQVLIDQLSTGTEEHQRVVGSLTREKQVLMEQLSTGNKEHQLAVERLNHAQHLLTEQLSAKNKEHLLVVQRLTQDKQALVEQLVLDKSEHESSVQQLVQKHERAIDYLTKEKQVLIDQLTTAQAQDKLAIKSLTKEKQELVNRLATSATEDKRIIGRLKQEQQGLIDQSAKNKEEHERALEQLAQEKAVLGDEKNALSQKNKQLEEQAALQKQKITKLEDILNNDVELQCQGIIRNRLTPLTKDYLMHLITDVNAINPGFNMNADVAELIVAVKGMKNWPQDEPSKALKQKFDAVSTLYVTLTERTEAKPSEKITQFYQQLNDANEVIKMHRDPAWQRYTTNAIAVLSIILTGVLPGLAVLAIASAVTGKSAMFWESSGHTFFKASAGEIENNILPTSTPIKAM